MNDIIFDLKATCWDGWRKSQNETIEIGAVLVNDKKEIENFIKISQKRSKESLFFI